MKKQLLFLLLAGYSFTTFAQRTIQIIQPRQQEVRCVKLMTMPDSYHDWIYGQTLLAQAGKITGKVIDINNLPAPYAAVMLMQGETIINGAYTNDSGVYVIDSVDVGKYDLKVQVLEYVQTVQGLEIHAGETQIVDVVFKQDINATSQEVLISDFKRPPFTKEARSGCVVAGKEVQAMGTRNIQAVAAITPGVYSSGKKDGLVFMKGSRKHANKKGEFKVITGGTPKEYGDFNAGAVKADKKNKKTPTPTTNEPASNETYSLIVENEFKLTKNEALSTFSADVDRAAYSNIRRFINEEDSIPKDAIRIEEMINYFPYQYPQPQDQHPIFIHTEYSACPWNHQNGLLLVALKAKEIATTQVPPSNLVFLLDVSGSMSSENKLPLLKKSLVLLVNQLRSQDKVAIVVYAGAAGLVLPSTSGSNKATILAALDNLQAGGSTAGGEGIELAYQIAKEQFVEQGNNRVILATDGDFNVGIYNPNELTRLIEEKRKSNIFLTCLGFGMGNYKDETLEILADKGNGNYAYIDDIKEAQKLFVEELTGTLLTVAKDVKIQVEFNPNKVAAYRLVGYENRMLNAEDFTNDAKDAGEMGAGHCVTAIYEIIPAKSDSLKNEIILRYQEKTETDAATQSQELAFVKVRYKQPKGSKSIEIQKAIPTKPIRWADGSETYKQASNDFRFAASVAMWGLLLRKSPFVKQGNINTVLQWAELSKGEDKGGYRQAHIELVKQASKQVESEE